MNLIGGLLISDPTKRFTWDDFFNHPFIAESDENDEDSKKEESEFGDLDSQHISIIKKNSLEKAKEAIDDKHCVTTDDDYDFEYTRKERTSDVTNKDKYKFNNHDLLQNDDDRDEKQSNSDENSEKLALKSSSTEYNFYNSDESRGQSMLSSNSSNIQPFKKQFRDSKNFNNSLKVVQEVSSGAIEEDPEEDIKTSKENSTVDKNTDHSYEDTKIERRKDHIEIDDKVSASDINKIKDFMRDLIKRSKLIMSFYDEKYLDGINGISK